nr:hypothetical protein CFP56_28471 [Quercus suber]
MRNNIPAIQSMHDWRRLNDCLIDTNGVQRIIISVQTINQTGHTILSSPTSLSHEYSRLTQLGENFLSGLNTFNDIMLCLHDCWSSRAFVPDFNNTTSDVEVSATASHWDVSRCLVLAFLFGNPIRGKGN